MTPAAEVNCPWEAQWKTEIFFTKLLPLNDRPTLISNFQSIGLETTLSFLKTA